MATKKYNSIEEASQAYFEAKARGDADGMQAANDAANAIRAERGEAPQYATGDIAGVRNAANKNTGKTVSKVSAATSNIVSDVANTLQNSLDLTGGYTPKSSYYDDDAGTVMSAADQAMLQGYKDQWNEAYAAGNYDLADQLHAAADALRQKYGYTSAYGDGTGYIGLEAEENPVLWGAESPNYTPRYDGVMDSVLNNIVNRDPFSYNYLEDPLFQQYFDLYNREGNRAMLDTYGQAANRTGGFASSYAIGAANQAQNYFMAQLADQIPALQQLAYERYLNEGADNYNQLGAIQGMDSIMYDRFTDDLGQWNTDRNFNYGVLRDLIGDALQADDTRYDRWLDAIELGLINPTTGGTPTGAPVKEPSGGYDNGSLTNEQVKEMQEYYGVSADGMWGAKSEETTGMTADEAWEHYRARLASAGGVPDGVATIETADVSDKARQIAKNLDSMRYQIGSKEALANTIAVEVDKAGDSLSDADARWLFKYFGYSPDEWLE